MRKLRLAIIAVILVAMPIIGAGQETLETQARQLILDMSWDRPDIGTYWENTAWVAADTLLTGRYYSFRRNINKYSRYNDPGSYYYSTPYWYYSTREENEWDCFYGQSWHPDHHDFPWTKLLKEKERCES